jgi:hypothetical protein
MAFRADLITINAFNATPSDTTPISGFGFYVGTTGNVAVMPSYQEGKSNPTPAIFYNVPAGQIIPISLVRIMATNTTASNIVVFGPV